MTDKTKTIWKHCKKLIPYTSANTSTMQKHLENNHSSLLKAAPVKKTESNSVRMKGQRTITNVFTAKLPTSNARATAITRDIAFSLQLI